MSLSNIALALAMMCASTAQVDPTDPEKWAALGDSITFGAPSRTIKPWPATLEGMLNARRPGQYMVGNYGVPGDTSASMLAHWTTDIRDEGFNGIIIGPCCVNDYVTDVPAATTETNIRTIIDQALSDGLRVVLVGSLPWKGYSSWTAERQAIADAWFALAETYDDILWLNPTKTFQGITGHLRTDWDVGDGLHTNTPGTNAIAGFVGSGILDSAMILFYYWSLEGFASNDN